MDYKGKLSSRQREFHPKPLTEPYVIVSYHTALIIQSYKYEKFLQCANKLGNFFLARLSQR